MIFEIEKNTDSFLGPSSYSAAPVRSFGMVSEPLMPVRMVFDVVVVSFMHTSGLLLCGI